MHVSEKNSDEQPEMVVSSSNTKEFGPMGQLAALQAEHDELKRISAAERDALVAERDALAKEVVVLKEQVQEASKFGEWMLEVKPDENSDGTKDTDVQMSKDNDKMDVESSEDKNVPFASMSVTGENILKSTRDLVKGCEENVKTRVESGTKLVVDAVADQFDEDGYIKALLPGNEWEKNRAVTMPTTKELVDACNVIKNHVEDGAKQVAASVADQFDEDGYIKALLPGEEADENIMHTLPTTKELADACDTVKSHIEHGAQQVLVSVADKFDENGFMKCCLSHE